MELYLLTQHTWIHLYTAITLISISYIWALPVINLNNDTYFTNNTLYTQDIIATHYKTPYTLALLVLIADLLKKIFDIIDTTYISNSNSCNPTFYKPNVTKETQTNNTFDHRKSTITLKANSTAVNTTTKNTLHGEKTTLTATKTMPDEHSTIYPHIYKSINVLEPIVTRPPLSTFMNATHPLQPKSIYGKDLTKPIHTNKFYSNFFLGTQAFPTYLDPYVVTWISGIYSGLTVSHTDDNQKVFSSDNPPSYFLSPLGIYSVVFSAQELNDGTLTLTSLDQMSVNAIITPKNCTEKKIEFPLVRGEAYITAIYSDLTPVFTSVVGFKHIEKADIKNHEYFKFILTLYDGKRWLLYAFPKTKTSFNLKIQDNMLKATTGIFSGTIQVAKVPINNFDAENILDASAGTYPRKVILSAFVNGKTGNYKYTFDIFKYKNRTLLHYAMHHHISSFDNITASKKTCVSLPSTTNGLMVAYTGDCWNMIEKDLPTDIDFFPYSFGKKPEYSDEALKAIEEAAKYEVSQNFDSQIDKNTIYFSGKVFSKLALLCLVINNILKNETLSQECLEKFNKSYMPFVKNMNEYKLVYDTTWKGIVTNQGFTKGPYVDFGASYYNDHHFHYGYMVFAAAVIGYINSSWIKENKDWIIDLIRDVANPVSDSYFPAFRSFDWFTGHSWAKGIFESPDGKDEESSSEDYNFYFAMKLFGMVTGDNAMISRANLMLAILKRSLHSYFLYESTNTIMPKVFLPNFVAGIKFMNKIHHTTYFSPRTECIQGIHMLPLTPISAYIRTKSFVQSEWDNKLTSIIDTINDGWKGILYANLAISDPEKSYTFFSSNFDRKYLDNGSSLAWYLVYSSAFANSTKS
ncbi:hypothetical protein PMAC_001673 [Pneumocystis sp. 'macacae']|nr:hypothetical protein PMAC_001673 [Pneumocystis sp. 'macacae']